MLSRTIKSPVLSFFFFSLALLSINVCGMLLPATTAVIRCHEKERQALLDFKQRLHDPSNRLSSWIGEDCCAWQGVGCSNITGRVTELHLRNEQIFYADVEKFGLHSDISIDPSLLSLHELTHLDLSGNDFTGHTIPAFLGSFGQLKYLNLSSAGFVGKVPDQLGNLSNLQYLDLSHNPLFSYYYDDSTCYLYLENPGWIARLTSLEHLNMSFVSFGRSPSWFQALNALPHIQDIELAQCELGPFPHSSPHLNFSSLRTLNLGGNLINGMEPAWLYNLTSLEFLIFGGNYIYWSPMQSSISKLASLRLLDLSSNTMSKSFFLLSLPNFCKLQILALGVMPINDTLSNLEMVFSGCLMYSIEELYLSNNLLSGYLPDWLGNLKNLKCIDLSQNFLHGSVGNSIGRLKNLICLDLSYNSFSLSLIHLANLSNLKHLDISNNILFMNDTNDWMPPFQLQRLFMNSCKIVPRPHFPKWLQTQTSLSFLYLMDLRIQDTIPNWLPSSLEQLDLSHNRISKGLTHFFPNLIYLSLLNNSFSGNLPPKISYALPTIYYLDLSMNNFSGSIPHSLCQINSLGILQLSKNNFSGVLPNCWSSLFKVIKIDFSNNQLYGEIPNSFCNLGRIQSLHLSYNYLSGRIPLCLQDCRYLSTLEMGHNNFTGNIPSWSINNLSYLQSLILHFNSLSGSIPELFNFAHLQILDLSNNNLSGSIPQCFDNFNALKSSHGNINGLHSKLYREILWLRIKGIDYEYGSLIILVTNIDLSNNGLSGYLPKELGNLHGLQNLNLSRNNLIGEIPWSIDRMQHLEALDLSRNSLSGSIPSTLSNLNFLDKLNLSYNNLSGNIPTGTQLQSFDPSTYIGNPYLCGPPLTKKCRDDIEESSLKEENKDGNDRKETIWLFTSITLGFIIGCWGIWGFLLFHKRWRILYFCAIDNTFNKLYVKTRVKIKRTFFVED